MFRDSQANENHLRPCPIQKYSISRFKPPALLSWSPIQNCLLCSVTGLPQNLNSKEIQILARLEGWFQNLWCDHNPEQSLPRQVLRWAAEEVLRQEWIALCVKDLVSIKGNGMEFPFLFLFFIAFEQKQKNGGRSTGEACRLPKEPEIEKQIVPKQILSTLKHASLRS